MSNLEKVHVDAARPSESLLLSNLLELYMHDLSALFPAITLGPDGRFGYPRLPLYWSEPARRYPFLIRDGEQIVGFALVTRGSPAASDPEVFDVAEFFVLRRFRRSGVGRSAAVQLWRSMPGTWVVRVLLANAGALAFWSGAIAHFAGDALREIEHPREPDNWRVLTFESR
jgi:predicted acetyltransferase